MNIILYTTPNTELSEETQNIKTKFFLIKKLKENLYEKITPYIKCRDFITDVLYCITFNTSIDVYRFKYNQNISQVLKENLYISLKFISTKAVEEFKTNFQYLNKFETLYNLSEYSTYEETDKKTVLLIKHNPFWFSNTLTLSLFTLILRCLSHPNITGNFWTYIKNTTYPYKSWNGKIKITPSKESEYIETIPLLKYFIINLPSLSLKYNQKIYEDEYDIHSKSGFISYLWELAYKNPKIKTIKDTTQCQEDVLDVIPS